MEKRRMAKGDLALLAVFALVALVFYLGGIGCPIKFFTGVSCPGCGMTRAWFSVLMLDFPRAFAYHPLFFLGPAVVALACFQSLIDKRVFIVSLVAIAVLFVACWGLRMLAFFGFDPFGIALLGEHVVGVHEPVWLEWLRHVLW